MDTNPASLKEELSALNRELIEKFDPRACISAFDELPEEASYHDIPDAVRKMWSGVAAEFGQDGFDAFQRITMLNLIEDFPARMAGRRYTDEIRSRFNKSFERIVGHIADSGFENYHTPNDILYKDLALCRQKMFPAGAQVVEPDSVFHRSLMFSGGLGQAMGFVGLLLEVGGYRHWYQIHTHLSELEDFNPEGWDACYLRIADMLELHPEIRGMWGGSWFYDPALEKVSPRLVYLRDVPQQNGARLFFSQEDIEGGALAKSKSRRQAFEAGEYVPKSYALIWPRKALLAWAAKMRAETTA